MPLHYFGSGTDSFQLPIFCQSVGTSDIVLSEAGGAAPQIGVSEAWEAVSGSANDAAAGTGARKIKVIGFKAGALTVEEITMNGVTAVATAETTWSGQIIEAFVSEAGSGKVNAGDITVRKIAAGGDRLKILLGRNSAPGGMFVVPTGKVMYVRGGTLKVAGLSANGDAIDIRLCANVDRDTNAVIASNPMIPFHHVVCGNSGQVEIKPLTGIAFPAGATVALIGKANAGTTGKVSGFLDVLLSNAA